MEHSRLFNLDLLGAGSEDVECFTSYCTRLAESHAVTLHTLVTREIFPNLNKPYLFSDGKHVHDSVGSSWWKTSSSLNGLNSLTEEWVTALNELTGRQDLQYLTLLAYSDVLPYRGLLRRVMAWCPKCYEEWLKNGQAVYTPLRWTIEAITVCPYHKCLLETQCPFSDCQKSFSALSSNGAVGFCPYCNRWLGSADQKQPVDYGILKSQQIINASIGEMIAASSSSLLFTPHKANISLLVKRFIDESLDGNAKALADVLKMHHKSIYEIRDGTQLPQLSTLLRLSEVVDIRPLQILTEDISSLILKRFKPSNDGNVRLLKKKHYKFDEAATREMLETVIANEEMPPPSMAKVSQRLGYDHSFLSNHLPEQCSIISERHRQYQAARKKARLDQYCERIRQVTTDIHSQGKYPSYKQVSKIVPALFKEPLVREAYHNTMAELGYKRYKVY